MNNTINKSGYLYVLAHPDLPGYYKLGQTTKHPTERLKTHNKSYSRIIGYLARVTGRQWQLIYYIPVTDARRAESATLWYDVLPRWNNLEVNRGDIRSAIEDIKKNPYLDQVFYAEMVNTELSFYDYEAILGDLEREWSRDGIAEEGDIMIKEFKEERNKKDKRRRWNSESEFPE